MHICFMVPKSNENLVFLTSLSSIVCTTTTYVSLVYFLGGGSIACNLQHLVCNNIISYCTLIWDRENYCIIIGKS